MAWFWQAIFREKIHASVLVVRSEVVSPKVIATGSPRRRAQLLAMHWPEAQMKDIRGNAETRLRKIAEDHEADATVLAAAGLRRLGIRDFPGLRFEHLPIERMVPAPGKLRSLCRFVSPKPIDSRLLAIRILQTPLISSVPFWQPWVVVAMLQWGFTVKEIICLFFIIPYVRRLIFPDCLILPLWSVRYRFLNHNEPQRESLSRWSRSR